MGCVQRKPTSHTRWYHCSYCCVASAASGSHTALCLHQGSDREMEAPSSINAPLPPASLKRSLTAEPSERPKAHIAPHSLGRWSRQQLFGRSRVRDTYGSRLACPVWEIWSVGGTSNCCSQQVIGSAMNKQCSKLNEHLDFEIRSVLMVE